MEPDIVKVLEGEETFVTTILAVMIDKYGTECLEWEPEVIALQLEEDYKFRPSSQLLDKIQAGATVLTTNQVHLDLTVFNSVSCVMSFAPFTSEAFLPADLDDVLWSLTEIKMLEGQAEKDENSYSSEIAQYVGYLLNQDGVLRPPSVAEFALYPTGSQENVQNNLLSDEIFFQAFWKSQDDKKAEIEKLLQMKLIQLFSQISNLNIKSLDKAFVQDALNRLGKNLATEG